MNDLFSINRYMYVDVNAHSKHVIYARNMEFADELAKRISALGIFKLRRAKIFFAKKLVTDIPPYEIEQEQLSTVESWEEKR